VGQDSEHSQQADSLSNPFKLNFWTPLFCFFRTDVLTSKFGGVCFTPSFPFLSVMYLYSHIRNNVLFKFGGKEYPFVFLLFMFCFDKNK
jgi:hypothetical protein